MPPICDILEEEKNNNSVSSSFYPNECSPPQLPRDTPGCVAAQLCMTRPAALWVAPFWRTNVRVQA